MACRHPQIRGQFFSGVEYRCQDVAISFSRGGMSACAVENRAWSLVSFAQTTETLLSVSLQGTVNDICMHGIMGGDKESVVCEFLGT